MCLPIFYDRDKCIEILMLRDHMSYETAVEFFEFNTIGAWMGENTPAFATLCGESDEKQVPSVPTELPGPIPGVRPMCKD